MSDRLDLEELDELNDELVDSTGVQAMEEAIERARGHHRDYCVFSEPNGTYYVSNLSPGTPTEDDESEHNDEDEDDEADDADDADDEGPFSESSPSSIGIRARLAESDESPPENPEIAIRFEFYLRCLPTWDEYRDLVRQGDQTEQAREFQLDQHRFFSRFDVELEDEVDLSEPASDESARLTARLNDAIDTAVTDAERDRIPLPVNGIDVDELVDGRIRDPENLTEAEFDRLAEAVADSTQLEQEWEVELEIERIEKEIYVRLTNVTSNGSDLVDDFLFNPKITLTGSFTPYELAMIPQDFRYDREIWAKGQNCSSSADEIEDDRVEIQTVAVPDHQTHRFDHREEYADLTFDTSPERLSEPDFIDELRTIESAMRRYRSEWMGAKKREYAADIEGEALDEYEEAGEAFEKEIENFARGIDVLAAEASGLDDEYDRASRAFRYMNEAFDRQGEIPSWRLFQIVFIVSNIPSLVCRDEPGIDHRKDEAEVLWFPTGGGKTEAYLGLILFGLLFDRLRGKNRGVTAWIRFPLTLLGKQQLTRFINILTHADEVRQDHQLGGEEFSIGYYAGSGNTPNSIGNRNDFDRLFQTSERTLREECLVIETCPHCEGEVDVQYEPGANRVYHTCQDCDTQLPLYVTDHEIYRYVPSVLLGTLDKISVMGSNTRFYNLLGNHTIRCPEHGYGYIDKCSEIYTMGCDDDESLIPVAPDELPEDPVPSLHLVDEVHLLGEELGVFAGHYETFYLDLCEKLGGTTPKIITSTATISDREGGTNKPAYTRHMENLFLRDANRFPEEGPSLEESFYGEIIDENLRKYIGVTPNNKTHIYAVLDLAKQFHEVIRDYHEMDASDFAAHVGLPASLTESQKELVLAMYELSVVYFLKKTEKDRFMRSMRNQIRREMAIDGYDTDLPVEVDQLTADTNTDDLLEQLENPSADFADRIDSIAATSFIGHGIDVDRFNNMFFFGFPPRTFQYIQSSSRVGRKYPGFVLDVFKPFKQRDRHRYKYFEKTHEYLTRTVEDISVDRWSKFSLNKTFPGIFKGVLLQEFGPELYRRHGLVVSASNDMLDILDEIENDSGRFPEFTLSSYTQRVREAYGLDDAENRYFESEIEKRTENYIGFWEQHLVRNSYTIYKKDEMHSLRDIGEEGEFTVDDDDSLWSSALIGGGS